MKLAPRIIQAMELLQLPVLALQERIEEELQSNPVLEMREPAGEGPAPADEEDSADLRDDLPMVVDGENGNTEDFQRLADFEDEYGWALPSGDAPPQRPVEPGERDRKLDAMANAPAPEQSLNEYLLQQWAFVETDPATHSAGETIINFIDEDGYLRTALEEIRARTNPPVEMETLLKALRLVQLLEPPGVGARNLKECLEIQLAAEAAAGRNVELETLLVGRFLRDIERNRLPQIAKRTGRSLAEVKAAIENLSHLNPRPGLLIGQRTVPVITPDVVVDITPAGEVVVTMPDGNSPRLYISRAYRRMARDRATDKAARAFVQKNIRSAQWLIGAIQQRRETVRRVAEEVFKVQKDFLYDGQEALKPLPMADVAAKVGVHVATVSRAVAGKYVQTPRGIYPLRMFFAGGTTTSDGQDLSWGAIKAKLQEIVNAEDKAKPLNDEQLASQLKKHGIDIARRTVAKYRKLMNIPPARQRREY